MLKEDPNQVAIEKGYLAFSEMISYETYLELLAKIQHNKGTDAKWNFIRATHQAHAADLNERISLDISNALLCCAIEAMNPLREQKTFVSWILENSGRLAGKTTSEIEKEIKIIHQEYLDNQENREGVIYNFKTFLQIWCPEPLQAIPVVTSMEGDKEKDFPFPKVIVCIYSEFRSQFMHEGVGSIRPASNLLGGHNTQLFTVYRGKSVLINYDHEWFKAVVKRSLLNYAVAGGIKPTTSDSTN